VAAEVFVNLITGAVLPERGDITVFGRSTRSIEDSSAWMTLLDRFGIVSERAVLLDALSVTQNLAMPFTLEIEPPREEIRIRAEAIAREVGLPASTWNVRAGALDRGARLRVRLGRALALDPVILVLEHATAGIASAEAAAIGGHLHAITARRGSVMIAATADDAFASAAADRGLTLEPGTGRPIEPRPGRLMAGGRGLAAQRF